MTTYPFPPFADRWPNAGGIEGVPSTNGDVIGTDSCVTRDVAPYTIVAGNPTQLLRLRFDEATIARLLALRWWEWSDERIAANVALLSSGDIEGFIEAQSGSPRPRGLLGRLLRSRR